MAPKKEPCRNFQRGSCQYGDRCKFLHVAPHHSRPNPFGFGTQNPQQKPNPFGFGSQNLQQKPNPFGFGVQNQQPRGGNDFGPNQNQFKPFENKWTRSSLNNTNSSTAPRQPDTHKCTDPESCRRVIVEDFQNESPMWKLTCYGHSKSGPCDILGDVSYEELRAIAYDDAKRGLNMQSIVERERNLLQAKLLEFESLARNPYAGPSNSAPSSQSSLAGSSVNATVASQNNAPHSVSSFSQLGASLNTGISSSSPSNLFGQPNAFQKLNSGPLQSSLFLQPNSVQNVSGNAGAFGLNNSTFGSKGTMANQITQPTLQSPFTSNSANLGAERNSFPTSATLSQIASSAINQSPKVSSGPFATQNAAEPSAVNIQLMNNMPRENGNVDDSIWMKSNWTPGEIPEEAPPDKYIS